MRRGRDLGRRIGVAFVLLAGAVAAGCQQPMPYYVVCPQPGAVSTLPARTVVAADSGTTVAYGDVCTLADGTIVRSGSPILAEATPITGPVVVSNAPATTTSPLLLTPSRPGLFSGIRGWRASDPPQRLTIKAEGAYDDGSTVR
jgi:hypothetical protein